MLPAPSQIPTAAHFHRERELLRLWAASCTAIDAHEILGDCGLSTAAASPPNTMDRIYVMGERERDDAGGYSAEDEIVWEPADLELLQVHEFMEWYEALRPMLHAALIARHRRLVSGQLHTEKSERWVAVRLYGWHNGQPEYARFLLAQNCELGYGALRRWINVMRRGDGLAPLN